MMGIIFIYFKIYFNSFFPINKVFHSLSTIIVSEKGEKATLSSEARALLRNISYQPERQLNKTFQ